MLAPQVAHIANGMHFLHTQHKYLQWDINPNALDIMKTHTTMRKAISWNYTKILEH